MSASQPSASNGTAPQPSAIALASGLGSLEGLLSSILSAVRSETLQIGVSDAHGQGLTLEHWPVTGSRRVLAYRTGNGTDGTTITTTGQLLVPPNEGRIGMTWINAGANPALLYLTDQVRKGSPAVWLAANGGSWDGRFGGLPWSGNVFAVSTAATTTLVGGEL